MNTVIEKSKNPLITIGFMTYNHFKNGQESLFTKAIESLIAQDYSNKEILICDDGSVDETYDRCIQYANRYPFIKVLRNDKNIGPLINFEKLLSNISGEYFLWACPDDSYHNNFVSECIDKFNENNKAIFVTSALRINYDNGDIKHYHYYDFLRGLPFRKMVRNVLKGIDSLGNHVHYPPVIHSSMVKTCFIPRLYCREEFYGFEEAWFLNALVWGEIDYIDKVLYFRYDNSIPYQIKNPNISKNFSDKWYFVKAAYGHIRYFLKKENICLNKKLKYIYLSFLFLFYRILPNFIKLLKIGTVKLIKKIGFMRYQSKI
jgi:glycosyltransferase involved in cell wall biosynthesis